MQASCTASLGRADAGFQKELKTILDDRLVTNEAVRRVHSRGEGLPVVGLPDAVAFPRTSEEVAAALRLCHGARVPVVPFGTGTSLEGHVAAIHGGICVDLGEMKRIIDISPDAPDCRVEAGVTRGELNAKRGKAASISPSIPEQTPRSAAWRQRAHWARRRCGTAACARTCSGSR